MLKSLSDIYIYIYNIYVNIYIYIYIYIFTYILYIYIYISDNDFNIHFLVSICDFFYMLPLDGCNCIQTHNHLVHKRKLNDLAKLASLAKWLNVRL